MINVNGDLIAKETAIFSNENRAFKYGDAIFETLKVLELNVVFLEEHYFRLMASLRMLRMEIPMYFTLEYFEFEILKVVNANNLKTAARVRFTVFRSNGGLYTPTTNTIEFVIEATELNHTTKPVFEVELYKDFYVHSGLFSTIKTTNRALNVVASVFADENDYDTCILINEKKQVVEAINGNIFLVTGNSIVTPSLSEGCINGIIRAKLIGLLSKINTFAIEERPISPFELKKVDEVFITNSIIDIQPITNYRKKEYTTSVSTQIKMLLKNEYV